MLTRLNVAAMLDRLAAGTLSSHQLQAWAISQLATETSCDDEVDGDSISRLLLQHIATHGLPENLPIDQLQALINAPTCQHSMTMPLLQKLLSA